MEIQFRRQDEQVSTLVELTEQMQRKNWRDASSSLLKESEMSKYQIPEYIPDFAHPFTGLNLLSNDREFRDECAALLRKHRDIWQKVGSPQVDLRCSGDRFCSLHGRHNLFIWKLMPAW
uniref:Uncharacterized protein n=1 Tax=Triticum urartu TaxID=4572 RepID=A0A8R7R845_TRIUA